MTPIELIDLAFDLLLRVNAVCLDQYFEGDPSNITYCKIELSEPTDKTVAMVLNIIWFDQSTRADESVGPRDWQHQVALSLVGQSPEAL